MHPCAAGMYQICSGSTKYKSKKLKSETMGTRMRNEQTDGLGQKHIFTLSTSLSGWYNMKSLVQKWLGTQQAPSHYINSLTHWGHVTHICVGKLTILGSDNGLSPGRRQAIIWTNAGILLIGPLGTNFSEILIEIKTFSFKKMRLKMSSAKWRPFCLGLNVLMQEKHNSIANTPELSLSCTNPSISESITA